MSRIEQIKAEQKQLADELEGEIGVVHGLVAAGARASAVLKWPPTQTC